MTFCRIKKILEANGWCLVRIRGSHNQFRKAGNPYAVTVPDHGSRDITIGVIKDLEKNKAEAEKTDEQRYSEEQDAIDRQTKKKLQERADTEKMEHLPSEGNIEHKQHELKIVASDYEDIVSGKKSFELRKNDRGYKQGDNLKMLEFKDGKHTGRTIDADIIYMLEDYTGLTEGYCILGIRVTDYTGKVSETDTESGAEHE